MPSIAELSAMNIVEASSRGEAITLREAVLRAGGSEAYAQNGLVPKQPAFKAVMSKYAPKFSRPLDKALKALAEKDMTMEKVATLVTTVDVLNKNRRLEVGNKDEHTQPVMVVENFNYNPIQHNTSVVNNVVDTEKQNEKPTP